MDTTGSNFEYNAPQMYCDLSERLLEEPDDSYFDGAVLPDLQTPMLPPEKALRSSSRLNAGTPLKSSGNLKKPVKTLITPKKTPFSETVKIVVSQEVDQEDKENSERYVTPKSSQKRRKSTKKSPSVGTRSSPRLAEISKAMRRSNAARRSTGSSTSSLGADGANLNKVVKAKPKQQSLPKLSGKKGLSEDDMKTLENIAVINSDPVSIKTSIQNVPARLMPTVPQEFHFTTGSRLRQKKTEHVEAAPKKGPLKAVHGPTRPQEFHFATDERIKKQPGPNEDKEPALPFPMSLRSASSMEPKETTHKGPTIPQPFNLTETRKGTEGEANKFISVAELNLAFHTRTPQRFRSKRSGEPEEPHCQQKKNKITIPVTPNFTAKTRSRTVQHPTREEEEMKELEEAQKHMFKARPVNKKVFEPPADVFIATKKKSTIPEPFNITKTKKEDKPLGANLKEMCETLGCSTTSVSSLPWGGVPSKWSKRNTEPKPFSFDTRDKNKLQEKQEKIKKVLEEEKKLAEFHAHPMPIFEEGIRGVPPKKPPTPTRVRPFHLMSDERGELKQEQIHNKLEEEERIDRERRTFFAQSDAVVHKQPFIPEKSKKPLTDISGFTLNTEVRAEERSKFELHQKQREDELLAAKREQEEKEKAEAAAEVARMRKEAVHKANPVRNYKPVVIKPAPCLPTVPVSPNFATKTRLRSRRGDSSANSSMDVSSINSTVTLASATFTAE
ncbi:targeting protein for Xklp2 homolog isoform X1 [Macrobrachium nipponense]|uniref:targeting protein for Xklp2 homolog isoform X1 n=1 Tax=Macrobrachium nipponense TaxID=159736 RepID=UPI0030C7C7B1